MRVTGGGGGGSQDLWTAGCWPTIRATQSVAHYLAQIGRVGPATSSRACQLILLLAPLSLSLSLSLSLNE